MLVSKNRLIRRRALIGLLILASLALISVSWRQGSSGEVGSIQRTVSGATAPASSVVHRISQPFADAWSWTTSLIDARNQAAKYNALEKQYSALVAANAATTADNRQLKSELGYKNNAPYPVTAATVVQANHDLNANMVVIDHGTADGLTSGDPVIAPLVPYTSSDGTKYFGSLVGVTGECGSHDCPVNLITNTSSPVGYTARVLGGSGGAQGTLQPAPGTTDIFNLTLIPISARVPAGGVVVTSSINSNRLQSRIPAGIPIGQVLDVSQSDAGGPSKDVTVKPFADFQSLGDVLVMRVPNS